MRPCTIKGRKATFHRWQDKAQVVPPSPMVGGSPGGQLQITLAIVEYEDGSVHEAYPYEVVFTDKKMDLAKASQQYVSCIKIKNKIGLYRESKTDTIFDAFYHADLDIMEELEPYVTVSKGDDDGDKD